MSSERPPGPERDEVDGERRLLERIVPEIVKRIVEAGYEKISEGPENVRRAARDLKLPKEAIGVMFSQLEETKNGLIPRRCPRGARLPREHQLRGRADPRLTTLSFEIKTEVRFIPNESRSKPPVPDVRSKVSVKRRESAAPPPPARAAARRDREHRAQRGELV